MNKNPLFWETFLLILVVGIANYYATRFHLYWSITEFDSLMHFLAGAASSMIFLWLYFYSSFFSPTKRNLANFLIISMVGSTFVIVSWEIFELILGEAEIQKTEYAFDTSLDLIMDFLGVLAACFYGYVREIRFQVLNKYQ